MENTQLDLWAVVDLFGHTRIAGRVTEQSIGPATFVRIDVPETEKQPSFTRLVNPSAIYSINPVTEEVARHMANSLQNRPIESWDITKMNEKLLALKSGNKNHETSEWDNDD